MNRQTKANYIYKLQLTTQCQMFREYDRKKKLNKLKKTK